MQVENNEPTNTQAAATQAAADASAADTTILTGGQQDPNASAQADQAQAAAANANANADDPGTILTGAAAKAGEAGQADEQDGQQQDPNKAQQPPQQAADAPLQGVEGMEYAQGELDELTAIAQKHNIPQAAAADILQWQAKFASQAAAHLDEELAAEIKQHVRNEAVKNAKLVHQEWGTDPKTVADNEAAVALAMRQFADDDFKALMQSTGLGSHPAVVRVMLKVGKAISDDKFIAGNKGGGSEPKDLAHRMFPNVNNIK